jgi:hypothetical protein
MRFILASGVTFGVAEYESIGRHATDRRVTVLKEKVTRFAMLTKDL